MFKISKLTDYSLRIIAHLSGCAGELQSAVAVASATGISEATVRKILKCLNGASFLASTQGATGGYQLTKSLADISLVDLITTMEGAVAITDCSLQNNCCVDASRCGFQDPWRYVNTQVQNLLANISLADMLQRQDKAILNFYPKEQYMKEGSVV